LNNGLPERLKRETRDLHAEAERSGVMHDLLRGRIDVRAYCALLRNLHAIYSTLEAALDRAVVEPGLQRLHDPSLRRSASLAQDLDHLHAGRWQDDFAIEPATAAYIERLRSLAIDAPRRLAAHAYVRYLGDLHGGQVLQKVVRQRFGLVGGDGTRFYEFGPPAEVESLRQRFRAGLASVPASAAEAEAIVAEARWAFDMHKALFVELQARHGGAAPG
jgi:heme oxygenase (biliverdin-producing, ferredoxin)